MTALNGSCNLTAYIAPCTANAAKPIASEKLPHLCQCLMKRCGTKKNIVIAAMAIWNIISWFHKVETGNPINKLRIAPPPNAVTIPSK